MYTAISPIIGENVYSILSRVHVIEGRRSPLETLQQWTGVRGYKPRSGLPTHLVNISDNLSYREGPLNLISAHTHFSLYEHFLTVDRRRLVLDAMLFSGAAKSRLGLLRNQFGAAESNRYCKSCLREDVERHGVAIWHREHAFPWVMTCYRHGSYLYELEDSGRFGDRKLSLPSGGNIVSYSLKNELQERFNYISEQISTLINYPVPTLISVPVYRRILKEMGFITRNGRIRQRDILDLIKTWMEPLKNHKEFSKLFEGLSVERNWLAELVAGKDGFHHPMKHIMLWGGLSIDAIEVLNTASAFGEQLEMNFEKNKSIELSKDLVEEVVSITGSYRKAAEVIGVDITTLLVAVDSFGLQIKRRSKTITPGLRKKIIDASKTMPTAEVAKKYDISITSVNRIRRGSKIS